MKCTQFDRWLEGRLSDVHFDRHKEACPVCRKAWQFDRQLLQQAGRLAEQAADPQLWLRIEQRLREEKRQQRMNKWRLRAVAAVLVVMAGLALFWIRGTPLSAGPLLDRRTRQVMENREQDYQRTIDRLEAEARAGLNRLPPGEAWYYRDRLDHVDGQIRRCRRALTQNPANRHIRRYLLLALRDKSLILNELINKER